MALTAGAALLSTVGHLANLGQFAEIGQAHAYQREQMQWARRAYCLDSRALRIDLLNAVKEDVRDHHGTHTGRIDTLLLVHTLLLTFALATLQYSDEFVPQSGCIDCAEEMHPWLVTGWVFSVAAILILPFWSIVMLIWCKLQLDGWLERSLGRLNVELRASLAVQPMQQQHMEYKPEDPSGQELLEVVEDAVVRLGGFVVEHQDQFKKIWGRECRAMTNAATCFLWVSCVVAIVITSGMFWLFLENHMKGQHDAAGTQFAFAMVCGLLAPCIYFIIRPFWGELRQRERRCRDELPSEAFEDCVELTVTGSCSNSSGGLRSELFGELLGGGDGGGRESQASSSRLQVGRGLSSFWSGSKRSVRMSTVETS